MDNTEEMALNQIAGEGTSVDTTPVVEEQTAGETTVESSEPASPQETTVEETDQKPKKGANARIGELVGEVKSLKQRLAEISEGNGEIPTQQFQPQVDLDSGEVTQEQYRQHIMQQADSIVTLRIKQSEAVSRIDKESQEVMRAYPQLDPESEHFDKELSETISEAIEAQVKLNPYSASVKKFADKLMKPFAKAVSNGVAQEKETITRQVSESALRPTNVRKQEKSFAELTLPEMEARLGMVDV